MAELGNKWECSECGTKFYDLGKAEGACPQCGTPAGASEKDQASDKASSRKTTKKKKRAAPSRDTAKADKPTELEVGDSASTDDELDPDLEPTLDEDVGEDG